MWLYKEFKRCRKFSTRCICDLIISDRNTHLHQLHWLQRDLKSIFPKKTDLLQVLQHLLSKLHRYICFRNMKCVKNNILEIKSFYHLIPPWEERWQRFTWCKLQHLRWPMFSVTPSRNLSRSNLFSSYSTETLRSYSKNIFLKKHSGCQRNYHLKKNKKKRVRKDSFFLSYSSFCQHICENTKLISVEFKLCYEAEM